MSNASVAIMNRSPPRAGAGPKYTSPTRANVAALEANHPTVSKLGAIAITPAVVMRPCVVRMPNMPQKLAGTRTEPPVSVPSAKSHRPAATADAEPLDEPPGTRSGAFGLIGVPKCGLVPNMPQATSSVCVLPMQVAPAPSTVSTAGAVAAAAPLSRNRSGLPQAVVDPSMSNRSLTAKVRPASAPCSVSRNAAGL